MAIDLTLLKAFRDDMNAAMAAVYEKHGLTSAPAKINYTPTTFKFSVEVGLAESIGSANPAWFKGATRFGFRYGVTTDKIGKSFKTSHGTYEFLGINQTGHFAIGRTGTKMFKIRADEMNAATWL